MRRFIGYQRRLFDFRFRSTLATDSLRAQRNHRLDATSSACRNPAGKKCDAQQEQGDTRESDRIGSAHAIEQALHHERAAEGNK